MFAGAAVACSKPAKVSEDDVVAYLSKADPAAQRTILDRAGVAPVQKAEASPPERTDLVGRGGRPLTLVGKQPEVGDVAPDAVLKGDGLAAVKLSDFRGKNLIVSVVPSIDTRVCELQTHRMTDQEASLPPNTALITVSRDLPFAQSRFVEDAQIKTTIASDYDGGEFGKTWGLEVKETGLLARSVWVLDAEGKVVYRELVADQGSEPNYDAAFAAVAELAQ